MGIVRADQLRTVPATWYRKTIRFAHTLRCSCLRLLLTFVSDHTSGSASNFDINQSQLSIPTSAPVDKSSPSGLLLTESTALSSYILPLISRRRSRWDLRLDDHFNQGRNHVKCDSFEEPPCQDSAYHVWSSCAYLNQARHLFCGEV